MSTRKDFTPVLMMLATNLVFDTQLQQCNQMRKTKRLTLNLSVFNMLPSDNFKWHQKVKLVQVF